MSNVKMSELCDVPLTGEYKTTIFGKGFYISSGSILVNCPAIGEGVLTAINSYDSNQELIADLQRKVAWFEKFACKTCGGAGSVGTPPDDYYDCPDCVQPFNKMERDFKLLRKELTNIADWGTEFINADDLDDEEDRASAQSNFNDAIISAYKALAATAKGQQCQT